MTNKYILLAEALGIEKRYRAAWSKGFTAGYEEINPYSSAIFRHYWAKGKIYQIQGLHSQKSLWSPKPPKQYRIINPILDESIHV